MLTTRNEYKEADIVLSYIAYQSEVRTLPIIRQALMNGKLVLCPRVQGDEMEFYLIEDTDLLKEGFRGILEPAVDSAERSLPEVLKQCHSASRVLMLMPGCAFDRACGRLGYGKGFYDRYLAKNSALSIYKIALAYECQIWPEIPQEEQDVRPDMIITEKAIYYFH